MLKTYQKYIIKNFFSKFFLLTLIFLSLILILSSLEEITFTKDTNTSFLLPYFLTLINAPITLFEIFPFIFLISTQFFFIDIFENREIFTLRQFGMDNLNLLRFLTSVSFILGLIVIILFYNFSSLLKNKYLQIKNNYAQDKKYLAVITKNGLWIKDKQRNGTVIINAEKIESEYLINSSITQFDKNFQITKNIIAEKVNITKNDWVLFDTIVTELDNSSTKYEKFKFETNFDLERISNLFSDLTSLTYFDLLSLEKDYKAIGYSTSEINIQKHRFYSLPFLLSAMTIIATIIMIFNK